MLKINRLTD